MEECSVLIVGGGPAGLSVARAIGRGAVVVHKDAEIGLPVRTSGGSWKKHIDALGLPRHLYQHINTLRFASAGEELLFDFDSDFPVVLDITGTYRYLANLATKQGAEIRCRQKFTEVSQQADDFVVSTIASGGASYQIKSKFVIDASGYWRSVLPVIDPTPYSRYGIGAEYEFRDLSDRRDIATLLVGSRFTNPGYGWIFPTNQQTIRVGVGHARPDTLLSPKVSLDRLMKSELLETLNVHAGSLVSKHGGIIPNWGANKIFGANRIVGVGDAVGQALPLVGEGIRYCIETGNLVGKLLADTLKQGTPPSVMLSAYTKWWNKRYRTSFSASQWINERISTYDDASWDRSLRRLRHLRPDDVASLLQADVGAGTALRVMMANRDLPIKLIRGLVGSRGA